MNKEILAEIKKLTSALTQVIGLNTLSEEDQFSKEALDKAASEFQKLSIERGDWVTESDIIKIIKNAPYGSGKFIREEFNFTNHFKRGKSYYYNKKDLMALGRELKQRNVDLKRYMEYKVDSAKFDKLLADAKSNNKGKRKGKSFILTDEVNNISTSPPPTPQLEIIKADIKRLKEEFFENNFSNYVDIYHENHAMMKFEYYFNKYLDSTTKRKCRKWCDEFNYANHTIALITTKKEIFIPVKEEDMIQL